MDSLRERALEGRRLMIMSMTINFLLALLKIGGGLVGRSHALIADGVESSLDVLSSVMMWWAIRYGERPPDREHPYGHGKMESLAAAAGSLLLILVGLGLGWNSIREIFRQTNSVAPADIPAGFTLAILVGTIVTKELLFRWLHHRGSAIGSKAVQTDALHHRSDAFTSLAAGIGISAALIGGPAWSSADDWAALFSCLIILYNGMHMLRGATGDLLDEQIAPGEMERILAAALAVPGVTSVEKCRVRKSGLVRLADIHVRVNGECTVREGHRIGHEVKNTLLAADFRLTDVTVHIEPDES